MVKSYEELIGALGRSVFFRPERRRARELLSRYARPVLRAGGREYPLYDISMNGLSLLAQEGTEAWPVGAEVELSLLLHHKEVYSGRARVARVEPRSRGARIGLGLVTGFLDLPEVHRQDEEARLEREMIDGPESVRGLVPRKYREAVERAVHFVQYYRQSLDHHEKRYREPGSVGSERTHALAERAAERLRDRWTEIRGRASESATACLDDPQALRASKEYTEAVLTPLLMDAPMIRRSYTKPLGYPGDYQVMMYYYNNALEGESAFAKVFHKFFVEHPLSNGVRTRKDFIVEVMRREHGRLIDRIENPEYRVTSLGCGPAREVADFAAAGNGWPGNVVWTLIDQEDETLSVAHNAAAREVARNGSHGALVCLNLSFGQMLDDPSLMPMREPQHLIFSTGLFDYLREHRAQELIRVLYDCLADDGLLAVGNALGPNGHFWSPEFVLDWTLFYRNREQMLRLAALLPGSAEVEVVVEPGEAYYFLMIRRH